MAGAALALLLAGAAATALDWPAARAAIHVWLDTRDLRPAFKIVCLANIFSDGLGVAAILLLAAALDPTRRGAVARVAAITLVAGALGDGVNAALREWSGRAVEDSARGVDRPVGGFEGSTSWLAGFAGQLPDDVAHAASSVAHPTSSPISSHAAVAVALALGLAERYRRGRFLFPALASLAIAQRLLVCPDSPRTALVGAALGCGVCAAWTACAAWAGRSAWGEPSASASRSMPPEHERLPMGEVAFDNGSRQSRLRPPGELPNDAARPRRRAA